MACQERVLRAGGVFICNYNLRGRDVDVLGEKLRDQMEWQWHITHGAFVCLQPLKFPQGAYFRASFVGVEKLP